MFLKNAATALQAAVCWIALLMPMIGAAQVPVPPLSSPVTDLTNTLSSEQIASLDRTLRDFEARKGSQIGVLLVPTTQPETVEQYSIRVAEQWKLGRAGVDDGVLLLVAKDDRAVRIEVGYGLEGALPDVLANRITDQVIVPRFRQGDFAGGIREGVERIIAVIDGEPLPEAPPPERSRSPQGIGQSLPVLLMLVFVGGGIARRLLGGFLGSSAIGGVAGFIAWMLTGALVVGIAAGIIAFFFTLLTGGGGGPFSSGWGGMGRRRGRGGWTGGFGGGGWGGGGGGFGGGWSGGGGGFGGGGASGRW